MSFFHETMGRRTFLERLPAVAGAVGVSVAEAQQPLPVEHRHESPGAPIWRRRGHIPIFDAHLHVPSGGDVHWQVHPVTPTVDQFVAYLEVCGVSRGIGNAVRSQVATSAAEMIAGNREMLRWRDRKPGHFVPAGIVMPQYLHESLRELEDWRTKYGAVWIGELCNYFSGFRYDTPAFGEIMKKVAELGMIIHIHATNDEMAHLVGAYPDTTMVFAHMGGGARFLQRVELIGGHRRSYLEIAAGGHDTVGAIEYAVQKLGADRVLFGSDFSINDPSGIVAVADDALLPDRDKEKLFHV